MRASIETRLLAVQRRLQSPGGFSLVELVAVVAISGIILGLGTSVYLLVWRTMNSIADEAAQHDNIRVAFSVIVQEARWATELEFVALGDVPEDGDSRPEADGWYYLLCEESALVRFKWQDGSRQEEVRLADGYMLSLSFDVALDPNTGAPTNILHFIIQPVNGEAHTSSVRVLNVEKLTDPGDPTPAIRYKKVESGS